MRHNFGRWKRGRLNVRFGALLANLLLVAATLAAGSGKVRAQTVAVQTVPGTNAFWGIACSTTSMCDAVGQNSTSAGVIVPVTNGSAGSVQTVSGTGIMSGVACSGGGVCYAAGINAAETAGTIVPIANDNPGGVQIVSEVDGLQGIACSTSSTCYAVGVIPTPIGEARGLSTPSPAPPAAFAMRSDRGLTTLEQSCQSPMAAQAVPRLFRGQPTFSVLPVPLLRRVTRWERILRTAWASS
jgi:hypothetical protein